VRPGGTHSCLTYVTLLRDETSGGAAGTSADALRDQLLSRIDVIGSILEVDFILQSMQGDIEAILEDARAVRVQGDVRALTLMT
jgi:hypothetical protein